VKSEQKEPKRDVVTEYHKDINEFYCVYPMKFLPPFLNRVLDEWERINNCVRHHRNLDNLTHQKNIQCYHPLLATCLSRIY